MVEDAMVRVGHCCPDAPNVDIMVDGEPAFENIGFKEITEYAAVPEGDRSVSVVADGSSVLDASIPASANERYSILATGLVGDDSMEANVFTDEPGNVPSDKTHVRFVHASPDAPEVDVRVADGGPTLFERIGFRKASGYEQVDPGRYDLEAVPSGTDDVALSVPDVTLSGGSALSILAVGQLADDSLTVATADDTMRIAEVDD